jgi:hypothetical protein
MKNELDAMDDGLTAAAVAVATAVAAPDRRQLHG